MFSALILLAIGFFAGYWVATGTAPDIFPEGLPGSAELEGMIDRFTPPQR